LSYRELQGACYQPVEFNWHSRLLLGSFVGRQGDCVTLTSLDPPQHPRLIALLHASRVVSSFIRLIWNRWMRGNDNCRRDRRKNRDYLADR
jgi:hypothetical protein